MKTESLHTALNAGISLKSGEAVVSAFSSVISAIITSTTTTITPVGV